MYGTAAFDKYAPSGNSVVQREDHTTRYAAVVIDYYVTQAAPTPKQTHVKTIQYTGGKGRNDRNGSKLNVPYHICRRYPDDHEMSKAESRIRPTALMVNSKKTYKKSNKISV